VQSRVVESVDCSEAVRVLSPTGFLKCIRDLRRLTASPRSGSRRTEFKAGILIHCRMPKPEELPTQFPPGTVVGGVDANLVLSARYRRGLLVGIAIGLVIGVILGFVL
jgi:hypothetical protein